jgi:cell division initiation protein
MKISPLDIKKQEFAKKFKGYDPDEVDSYLQMVADELETVIRKNIELNQKMELLEGKLSNYTTIENVLQDTLLNSQKSAEETKNLAEEKADRIIVEAEMRAEKILAEARQKLIEIQSEITDLRNQKDTFIVNFKSLISTQRTLLDLVEKRSEKGESFSQVKMKADLSNEELDKVIDEFASETGFGDSSEHADDHDSSNQGEVF